MKYTTDQLRQIYEVSLVPEYNDQASVNTIHFLTWLDKHPDLCQKVIDGKITISYERILGRVRRVVKTVKS